MGDDQVGAVQDLVLWNEPFDAHVFGLRAEVGRRDVVADRDQDVGVEPGNAREKPLEQIAALRAEHRSQGEVDPWPATGASRPLELGMGPERASVSGKGHR